MIRIPPLEPFYHRYETLAVRIGVAGNVLFVAGSILFIVGPQLAASLCWVVGSTGMLVRALGRLYSDKTYEWHRSHGHSGGEAMARARQEIDTAPE